MTLRIENLAVDLGQFKLKDINLTLETGDFFALMGPTGAGKSVLLEALVGLVPQSSGEIYIDERRISHLPPEERGIGIVYQDYALFPHLNVAENISYGLKRKKHRQSEIKNTVLKFLDLVQLSGYETRSTDSLSGGEKQRVALARALAPNPRLLLLDEPLSSLDVQLRNEMRDVLRKLSLEGLTIIHVTHDYQEAVALAQKVGIIHNGSIIQTKKMDGKWANFSICKRISAWCFWSIIRISATLSHWLAKVLMPSCASS
jgi:ABC-type Fe3+/spermidine/putrescine transport system ATPase subunit